MKRPITFLLFVLACYLSQAQTPQQMLYQSVVRGGNGQLVRNSAIGVQISILQGSTSGTAVYSETFSTNTNENGLYSVVIGSTDDLMAVNWTNGPYYLRSRVDETGGTHYTIESVDLLRSVPFSNSVAVANDLTGLVVRTESDPVFQSWNKSWNDITNKPVNISTWVNDAGYITSYSEVQILSISHDTVFLTGGSFVVLPAGFDGDYNHLTNQPVGNSAFVNDAGYLYGFIENQILSRQGDTLYLTGGSYVVLPLTSERQDLANVTAFGHSANTHQLKALMDPTEPQDAITRKYLDSITLAYSHYDRGTHNTSVANECERVIWNGMYYNTSGTYTYAYANNSGYFSVDTLFLTIRYGDHHTYTRTDTNSYNWHGTTYTRSGTYMYAYLAANGCPSTDTLELTILNDTLDNCRREREATDTATIVACKSHKWYNQTVMTSGLYSHTLRARYGELCDSIIHVNIHIYNTFRYDTAIRSTSGVSWRGHSYSNQGDYFDTLTDHNGCDSIYGLHLITHGVSDVGCGKGLFSVARGLRVRFAQGNLLYRSANNLWMFTHHQYDHYDNPCVNAHYLPWADVFSWATSGFHRIGDSLNVNYHPWTHYSTSASIGSFQYDNNRYGYGPSLYMPYPNLTDSSANYDWGVYNPILNGGNSADSWITPDKEQWLYLLRQRANASQLRSKACINYINGYILLPDNWTPPSGIQFVADASSYTTNSYTLSQWERMEQNGAIFLPDGFYWTSSTGDGGTAYAVNTASDIPMVAPYNRSNQYYVRCAQITTDTQQVCRCTFFDTTIVSPTAITFNGESYSTTGDYVQTLTNSRGCDSIIVVSLMVHDSGQLDSLFSVSPSQRVYFSKGNLQYKTDKNIWRFATHQYDILGADNTYISSTNSHWMDLYGWGTSGYHDSTDNLNTAYQPWSTASASYYGPSPNMSEQNLVNESAQYDWGVHNPIANGGNQAGLWRTLTRDEWIYLMSSRPNATQLRRFCTIVGVYGLLILPDNWHLPAGFVWNADDDYDQNDWALLEASGVVFLPAAGYARYSDPPMSVGSIIYYWLSTADPYSSYAYHIYSTSTTYDRRYYRCAVRLVKNE